MSTLNLNLGLGSEGLSKSLAFKCVRIVMKLPSTIFRFTVETPVFQMWALLPVSVRSSISKISWSLYHPLHRLTLGKFTALHPSVSSEYAALTTLMWGTRLMPMTLGRMRFGLSQIECNFPPDASIAKEKIDEDGTTGVWVHSGKGEKGKKKVIFWIYGGAFLAGDSGGNVGLSESVSKDSNADVFLVDYRLCPENTIVDALEDVVRGYKWMMESGRVQKGDDIIVLGISSGGGLAVRLCQEIAKMGKPGYMPRGQVLLCPWVQYDWHNLYPSMHNNNLHDLIVTQSVYEYVNRKEVILRMVGGEENRTKVSPLGMSMKGLPKTLTVCSEHEVTADEDMVLHEKMKEAGVEATLLTRKYMCHVWCLVPMLPEAEEVMTEAKKWIREAWA